MPQYSLHALLSWAHRTYQLETPEIQHAVSLTDDGGAPAMKPAIASYLGLLARNRLDTKDDQPDNWKARAGRKDRDGKYVTPLRYSIELATDADERSFLRSLVPELYYPREIATIHGIPRWASQYVMYACLARLRERYDGLMRDQEKGTAANVGWVSRSESQRAAEDAA